MMRGAFSLLSFLFIDVISLMYLYTPEDPDAWKQDFMIESDSGAVATDDWRFVYTSMSR